MVWRKPLPVGGSSPLTQFVPLIAIFAIFYFLVLRPQSKKAKDHQKMLSELKKGDDVATQGGIIGRITGIKDNEVTLQVQEGVRVRFPPQRHHRRLHRGCPEGG